MADLIVKRLRELQPKTVRAYDAADEARDIAVPERRKKWAQVIEALNARPWVRAELLDKKGATLGYVDNDQEAGELEELEAPGRAKSQLDMRLILEAQRVALSYRDKEHTQLLHSIAEVMKVQTDSIKSLVALYQLQVDAAAEVAALRATAEAGGDLQEWIKLAEAAPQLAGTIVPMLRMLTAGRQPAKPKPIEPKPPAGTNGKPS